MEDFVNRPRSMHFIATISKLVYSEVIKKLLMETPDWVPEHMIQQSIQLKVLYYCV